MVAVGRWVLCRGGGGDRGALAGGLGCAGRGGGEHRSLRGGNDVGRAADYGDGEWYTPGSTSSALGMFLVALTAVCLSRCVFLSSLIHHPLLISLSGPVTV